MDIKLLKSSILSNNIPKFLIFVEEEPALSKQYITSISNTLNKAYRYYDTADEVIYEVTTNMKEDFVYIIYNDKKIIDNPNYITELKQCNRNIIVCYPSITNEAFLKNNSLLIVKFPKLDRYSLLAYAQKLCKSHKTTIEQSKLLEIVDCCDCSLGAVVNEMDKIFILEQSNSNVLVDYLLKNGFPDYRKVDVYKFIDKVLSRNKEALKDMHKIEDKSVGLIYLLYNNARRRLIDTRHPFYGAVMQLCYDGYNSIIDGTLSDKYVFKYILYSIYNFS